MNPIFNFNNIAANLKFCVRQYWKSYQLGASLHCLNTIIALLRENQPGCSGFSGVLWLHKNSKESNRLSGLATLNRNVLKLGIPGRFFSKQEYMLLKWKPLVSESVFYVVFCKIIEKCSILVHKLFVVEPKSILRKPLIIIVTSLNLDLMC